MPQEPEYPDTNKERIEILERRIVRLEEFLLKFITGLGNILKEGE
jgi:hypothetical protein